MNIVKGLTFDDVLLKPKYSKITTRSNTVISTDVDLGKNIKLKVPIISANMAHVTWDNMANAISSIGGMALLHRFAQKKEIISTFKDLTKGGESWRSSFIGCSVGVKKEDYEFVDELVNSGCKIICVDIAHAHSVLAAKITEYISSKYNYILTIVGNIATSEGAKFLIDNGADVVKCGIGNGAACTTRVNTGNGVPQLTALDDIKNKLPNVKIISDGGLRFSGDLVKALCFADAVMMGSLLAGTNESPGEAFLLNGKKYKKYAGSSTLKSNYIEGASGVVPNYGSVNDLISVFMEGLRSGMSYQGVDNLIDLKECPEFIQISNAGLIESHPHNMIVNS